MTFITKPKIDLPGERVNEIGLKRVDYEGVLSTLCAGCGHDSITASIVQAFWELSIAPHNVVKMSGIGCSSKTPAYFISGAHGFNSVHGRMPAVATGALAANRDLVTIGVSGDGDSLSIGFGQFGHAVRRNVNMLYLIENNGVYGLTKGQFSASADRGSKSKKGAVNPLRSIDPVATAIALGGSFVARGFSGDRDQLVPLIKAGIKHRGCAVIDIISPCVTFNDHEGSTKSYAYTRRHYNPAINAEYIPPAEEITAEYDEGETLPVKLHDGSTILLRKTDPEFTPTVRSAAMRYLEAHSSRGEVVTGLLYLNEDMPSLHDVSGTTSKPLASLTHAQLVPGNQALARLQERLR